MNARDFFLWAGCIAGIALTLYGAYDAEVPEPMRELSEFPSGSFAVVNGVPLGSKDLGASNSDERSDAFIDQRIEEELLIQKALDLGLLRRTPQVRQHLLSSMSEHIYAGSSKTPPSEAQLKAYFERNQKQYAGPATYDIDCIFFRGASPQTQEAIDKVLAGIQSGEDFLKLKELYGDKPSLPLPESPLPPGAMRMYLGPSAANIVEKLEPGSYSQAIRVAGGSRLVHLKRVLEAPAPVFEDHRERILDHYWAESRAKEIKTYIKKLRGEADIRLAPGDNP